MSEIMFHAHTVSQAKLQFCIIFTLLDVKITIITWPGTLKTRTGNAFRVEGHSVVQLTYIQFRNNVPTSSVTKASPRGTQRGMLRVAYVSLLA
jgi:hypothetical protein